MIWIDDFIGDVPEYCDFDTNLDGGIKTSGLFVVEVSRDAGSQLRAHGLAELGGCHPPVPEGQGVVVVLQPVREVDGPAPQHLGHQAAHRPVHVALAGDGETLRGHTSQGHVWPLPQTCRTWQLKSRKYRQENLQITI